jgi:hypothetical protein
LPERWYFYCDRLGILVWQAIESADEIPRLAGHPGIVAWLPATDPLMRTIAQLDPTRLAGHFPGTLGGARVDDRSVMLGGSDARRAAEVYGAAIAALREARDKGLAGAALAHLTDDSATQGILSMDRSVSRVPFARIAVANRTIVPQAGHFYTSLRDVRGGAPSQAP